ncbi:glutamine synthetase family protein [Patulibacter minatonensis]|uniref:glutamine synthetase family protein n=1 Tax=Patulibacter minatonensis TaxID=298163 RepID=UPI00047E12F0|nr:glutamine synthetase family protein [Patulibacter minatonensis]
MLNIDGTPEADFALRTAERRDVRFVRLWFVDVLGLLKAVAIPVSELGAALERGVGIDGSALEGNFRGRERDVIAVPDPTTFRILPWTGDERVARMFCNIQTPEGTASPGDSRHALERVLAQAAELGYQVQVGAEVEFFLFDQEGRATDDGTYFDFQAQDAGTPVRRRAIEHLESMGIPVKASHHEAAPSQHEIDLVHTDALETADAIVTLRAAVKEVAAAHGLVATFMPKPLTGAFGSGLHLHLSVFEDGENAFFDPDPERTLSPLGSAFLAGVLAHAREYTALTNQWSNSFKRLAPGFEAPEATTWTHHGRSALVRVPTNRPELSDAARVELRQPDPGCNPYLALACLIGAGLKGVEAAYQAPPADEEPSSSPALPATLNEAVETLSGSELVRDLLGDRLVDAVIRNKLGELDAERATVTEYERATLLRRL